MTALRSAPATLWLLHLLTLLCLAISSSPAAAQNAMRTWRAASGGFSVEAELIDVREDKVQLKKADGKELLVPIAKLSLADVRYIQGVLKEAREALGGGTASAAADPTTPEPELAADDAAAAAEMTKELTDDSDAAPADANNPDADVIGPGSARSPFAGMRDSRLVLGQTSAHELIFPAVLSPWLAQSRHGAGGMQYRVANIRTGKMSNFFSIEGFTSQAALSPDGLTLAAFQVGTESKLVLYSTATGRKQKEIATGTTSIQSLYFTSPQQLAVTVIGMQYVVQLYDVKSGKLVKAIDLERGVNRGFAVSPDGKLLAIPSGATVALYDLKSGKLKEQLVLVSAADKRSVSADEVAFCADGTELAVVANAYGQVEMHLYSVRSGKLIAKHLLSESSMRLRRPSRFLGPIVESIPGNKAYMLYGCAIIDRERGGPIWIDKDDSSSQAVFRVMVDDKRQLCLTGEMQALRFEVRTLPWNEIEQSKEIVAKGGTAADAGLPLVASANDNTARAVDAPINIKPYTGNRVTALKYAKPTAIPIEDKIGVATQLHFSRSEPDTAVMLPYNFGNSSEKKISLLDIGQGKVARTIELPFGVQVRDVSPGNKYLAGLSANNDRVDVFDLTTGKHVVGFRPPSKQAGSGNINVCRFVSDELLITSAAGAEAVAWELPTLKAKYRFQLAGQLFCFPVSPLFVHSSSQGWLVRQAKDGEVVGRLASVASDAGQALRMLHFRNDESACAAVLGYGTEQKLVTWDLLTGKRTHEIELNNLAAARHAVLRNLLSGREGFSRRAVQPAQIPQADSVSWIGEDQLLIRWGLQEAQGPTQDITLSPVVFSLFSLKDLRMLWDYRIPIGMIFETAPEGQLWFTEATPQQRHILVGASVPTDLARQEIAKAPPARMQIKPGESVKLESSVGISGDKLADGLLKDQVDATLVDNFDVAAVKISDRAALKLSLLVTQNEMQSSSMRGSTTVLLITARLTDISDSVLWQRDKVVALNLGTNPTQAQIDKARREQWASALAWIKNNVQPLQIYEKWYYRGIGESLLSSQGEKLIELKVNP